MKTVAVAALAAALGLLATVVHPLAPVAVIAGSWIVVGGVSSPFVTLLLFLLVLLTRPAEFIPAIAPLQVAKVCALGSLALFILGKLVRRDISWATSRQNRWLILLAGAVTISSVLGTHSARSLQIVQDIFLKILILYLLVLNLVDTPKRAIALQLVIAVADAFLGGYAIYAKMTGTATIEGTRAAAVGLLGDPNDLALALLMSFPFLLSACIETRGGRRAAFVVLLALVFGGIIATQSRGGILGLGAGLFFLLKHRIKSKAVVYGAVGLAVAGLVTVMGVKSRQGLGSGGIDESAQGRIDAWESGLRMFKAHPLFGVGVEAFPANYQLYAVNPVDWRQKATHNTYIQALAETGMAGIVPFMMLLGLSVRAASRLPKDQAPRGLERALLASQLPNMVGVLVSAFFLSMAWSWFPYILIAQQAAYERTFGAAPSNKDNP